MTWMEKYKGVKNLKEHDNEEIMTGDQNKTSNPRRKSAEPKPFIILFLQKGTQAPPPFPLSFNAPLQFIL